MASPAYVNVRISDASLAAVSGGHQAVLDRIAELEAQVKALEAEVRRLRAMYVDLETH